MKLSFVSQIVSEIDVSELLTFFLAVHGTCVGRVVYSGVINCFVVVGYISLSIENLRTVTDLLPSTEKSEF